MMTRKEIKGSHVVSIAAIKLGSCSQEAIVNPPQKFSFKNSLSPGGRGSG
jgi:hypothetical protein